MVPTRGLSCPVLVPPRIDWGKDYSTTSLGDLLALPESALAAVDPLAINLIVAKGISSLSSIDIPHYQQIVDGWVLDMNRRCLPVWEMHFQAAPHDWENDIRYFRLGMLCQCLALEVGIQYK